MEAVAVAWDDEATRRSWKRARNVYVAWFLMGSAALIGFTVYALRIQDHADRLIANGVHVEGTVLTDPPLTLRCGPVPVSIRFPIDNQDVTYPFYVNGCGGNGLHKGQSVEVSYSPGHPSDFTVNGRTNESPLAISLAIVGLVAGAFFVVGAAIRVVRGHRIRRTLRETRWKTRPATVRSYKSPWTRGRKAIALLDEEPHPVLVTQPSGVRTLFSPTDQPLVVAGTGPQMYVIKTGTSTRVVLARRPRSQRTTARAMAALQPPVA